MIGRIGHGYQYLTSIGVNGFSNFLVSYDDFTISSYSAGVIEPNAQRCAFAHPVFESQVSLLQILRTHLLGSNK